MKRPVVGITCYVEQARFGVWDVPAALAPLTYVRAVEAAGGRPLLVPPSIEGVDETLDALDAIVFGGGADLQPSLYGAEADENMTQFRPDRDAGETLLLEGALTRHLPVLAVCRGMQLLNVVRGGDLVPHLDDVTDGAEHMAAPGRFATHEVKVSPESRLASIVGTGATIASHHHQAPGRLGSGLEPVAWAPDGVVEGIEDPSGPFTIGVLGHPEEGEDRALFEALVAATRDGERS
ncbi:MAG: gamma-glutamyl-gamma-aminobutyrate hydrolase family protein [Actinomycetota bacterium]|nr:gamma-glutamyl-gamma-aminobutyrate hydrolase family protein [Actinomycetota bacterium]